MRRLVVFILGLLVALPVVTSVSEAGWKKRGWYQPRAGITCVMRKVATVQPNGRVIVRRVRVCK
jgi:hypothetical protein